MSRRSRTIGRGGTFDSHDNLIDALRQENIALKERCKEIRLNLQRRITELQDNLTISERKYLTELSDLKVEYGADLNRITRTSRENLEIERQNILQAKQAEIEELLAQQAKLQQKLRQDIEETEKRAQETQRQADHRVREAQRDLKKLKKESTGYSQGGWGTFIVAFEIEPLLEKTVGSDHMMSSSSTRGGHLTGSNQKPTLKKPKKGIRDEPESARRSRRTSQELDGLMSAIPTETDEVVYPHPIEKVSHFVEVGFLIDRNNFRLLNTHAEQTFDSTLKKYLFELQDPLSNYQMTELHYNMKQQFNDNVGLFNEINPVYVSLNMGRPSTPCKDDYTTQDKFKLVKREAA